MSNAVSDRRGRFASALELHERCVRVSHSSGLSALSTFQFSCETFTANFQLSIVFIVLLSAFDMDSWTRERKYYPRFEERVSNEPEGSLMTFNQIPVWCL